MDMIFVSGFRLQIETESELNDEKVAAVSDDDILHLTNRN
jgi:hypothetical protein